MAIKTTDSTTRHNSPWLDRYDVMEIWHISARQLYRYVAKKIFIAYTFDGGKKYFNQHQIEAALRPVNLPAEEEKSGKS